MTGRTHGFAFVPRFFQGEGCGSRTHVSKGWPRLPPAESRGGSKKRRAALERKAAGASLPMAAFALFRAIAMENAFRRCRLLRADFFFSRSRVRIFSGTLESPLSALRVFVT